MSSGERPAGVKVGSSRVRSLLGVTFVQALGYLATFAWTFWGARELGPARFGALSVAVAWALVLRQFLEFGHGQALTRFVPVFVERRAAQDARRLLRRSVFVLLVCTAAVVAISAVFARAGVGLPWFQPDERGYAWVPLAGLGAGMAAIAAGAWKGAERPSLGSFFSNTALPLSLVLCVALLPAEGSIGAGLLSAYGAVGLLAAVSLLRWWGALERGDANDGRTPARETSAFASRAMLIGFVYMGISLTDRLMLGELATLEETGIYTLASRVAYALLIPVYVLAPLVSPVFARIHTGRVGEALDFYVRTTAWSWAVVAPLVLLVALSGREVLATLGGAEYAAGHTALLFLILGFGTLAAVGTNGTLLQMGGQERTELNLSVLTLATNLVLNFWLIPRHGALGAAVATASSLLVSTACKCAIVGRVWSTVPWSRAWIPVLVGVGLAAVVHRLLVGAAWGSWWLRALVSLVPYACVLWFARATIVGRARAQTLERVEREVGA